MINVSFQPVAIQATSQQLSGREWEREGILFHSFQLNATSFMRLFQTASANESLGRSPPLLSGFSDLLEHFVSPSAIHITHCVLRHWLTMHATCLLNQTVYFWRTRTIFLRYFCIFLNSEYSIMCLPLSPYLKFQMNNVLPSDVKCKLFVLFIIWPPLAGEPQKDRDFCLFVH